MAGNIRNVQKVTIRLLEPRDEKTALELIWKYIFYQTIMDMLVDKITSWPIVSISVAFGAVGFYQRYSVFQGFVIFLTVPSSIYIIVRFYLLPRGYYNSSGFKEGLYAYWSQNDIGRYMWVAEVDGVVIGTSALKMISPTTGQVFRVVVKNEYRGKGIAPRLIQTVLQQCRKRHLDHVVLIVTYVQVAAQKLYEKTGFVICNSCQTGPPLLKGDFYMYHYAVNGRVPGIYAAPGAMALIGH